METPSTVLIVVAAEIGPPRFAVRDLSPASLPTFPILWFATSTNFLNLLGQAKLRLFH